RTGTRLSFFIGVPFLDAVHSLHGFCGGAACVFLPGPSWPAILSGGVMQRRCQLRDEAAVRSARRLRLRRAMRVSTRFRQVIVLRAQPFAPTSELRCEGCDLPHG